MSRAVPEARTHRGRLAALLVVLLGALVPVSACAAGSPEPTASPEPACTMPDPRPALVPGSLKLPAHPSVLVLGDSYTEGGGAEPATKGYAYLLAKPLGWRVAVKGVAGSGYVNPGAHGNNRYLQRLPALKGRKFDLVVVQGGSNDRDVAYPVLRDAVAQTIDGVRATFPNAAVVILGPADPYGKPDPTRLLAQCTLAESAAAQHLAFIDPIGESWFVPGDGKRDANPKNFHPSNAGHQQIADRFIADVRVLLGSPGAS
jgi:lysophospholipase L1-like esterase